MKLKKSKKGQAMRRLLARADKFRAAGEIYTGGDFGSLELKDHATSKAKPAKPAKSKPPGSSKATS